jgi:hypothetical protein
MWDAHTKRKPLLSLRLCGWLWLRLAARALDWLLFQEPPRTTRDSVTGRPTGCPARRGYLSGAPGVEGDHGDRRLWITFLRRRFAPRGTAAGAAGQ